MAQGAHGASAAPLSRHGCLWGPPRCHPGPWTQSPGSAPWLLRPVPGAPHPCTPLTDGLCRSSGPGRAWAQPLLGRSRAGSTSEAPSTWGEGGGCRLTTSRSQQRGSEGGLRATVRLEPQARRRAAPPSTSARGHPRLPVAGRPGRTWPRARPPHVSLPPGEPAAGPRFPWALGAESPAEHLPCPSRTRLAGTGWHSPTACAGHQCVFVNTVPRGPRTPRSGIGMAAFHGGGNGGQGRLRRGHGHSGRISGQVLFIPPTWAQVGAQGRPLVPSQVAPRSRAVSWLFLCHSPLLKEPPGSPAGQVGPFLRGGAEDAPRGVGRTGGQHLVAGGAASPSAGPG